MALGAVERGTPLAEFWTAAQAESAAGLGASPWYWETVYRTNVQTAYNAGRAAEVTRLNPPYLEFVGIEDSRQTSICQDRSGTILPSSHPFWQSNWPPLHFNCRSTIRAVFEEEVDSLREGNEWKPDSGDKLPSSGAAKGFGGNPIETESFYKMTPGMVERAEKYGLRVEIETFARAVGIKDYALGTATPQASVAAPVVAIPVVAQPTQSTTNTALPQFKTVKEAETYILNKNLADAVSFKGCDVRVVQEWTDAWVKTIEDFPEARKGMQFFGTIQERNKHLQGVLEQRYTRAIIERNIDPATAQALAKQYASRDIKRWRATKGTIAQFTWTDEITGISVNKNYGSDWGAFKRQRETDVAMGWKPKGTATVGSSLNHEVGHLLDWLTGLSNSPDINSLYKTLGKNGVTEGLSRYAAENIKEFVAEAWSEYRSSDSPRTLAVEIAEALLKGVRP